jgi:hypothetical protein
MPTPCGTVSDSISQAFKFASLLIIGTVSGMLPVGDLISGDGVPLEEGSGRVSATSHWHFMK